MGNFLIKGILIGIFFGIPVGAVGAMAAQRTLKYGIKAGLLTGLGSSAADCCYAAVGAFGLTMVSDVLIRYQNIINLAGGCLITVMGVRLLRTREGRSGNAPDQKNRLGMFASSFMVGITNPAAVLTFLFTFSWFGITGRTGVIDGSGLVLGVFIGTLIWWGLLSGAVSLLKRRVGERHLRKLNRVFAVLLLLFGAAVLTRNFLS